MHISTQKDFTPSESSKSHRKCNLHLESLCGDFSYSAGWASGFFKNLFLKNSSHLLRIRSCVSSSLRTGCCRGAVTAATCLYTCHVLVLACHFDSIGYLVTSVKHDTVAFALQSRQQYRATHARPSDGSEVRDFLLCDHIRSLDPSCVIFIIDLNN